MPHSRRPIAAGNQRLLGKRAAPERMNWPPSRKSSRGASRPAQGLSKLADDFRPELQAQRDFAVGEVDQDAVLPGLPSDVSRSRPQVDLEAALVRRKIHGWNPPDTDRE